MIPKVNYVEAKVKAAALATFIVSLLATSFLATTATDYVHALPDVFEAPAYSFLAAAATWIAGYSKKSTDGKLAPSTLEAAQAWIEKHTRRA
jgi:hypothetical protein